jgi:transposase InsO family protein
LFDLGLMLILKLSVNLRARLRVRRLPIAKPPTMSGASISRAGFLTGDGKRCEPLTMTDAHSRYLLRCQALPRTDTEHVWPVLDAAFREFGLPRYLRSDNGSPFASRGAGGLLADAMLDNAALKDLLGKKW